MGPSLGKQMNLLGVVSPHLPVGKRFVRFCHVWPAWNRLKLIELHKSWLKLFKIDKNWVKSGENRLKLPKVLRALRFKGTMANFKATNTVKQGKERHKDKYYPFHACTGGGGIVQEVAIPERHQTISYRDISARACHYGHFYRSPARTQGPCHIKNTTVILIHYRGGKKYDGSKTLWQGLWNTLFSWEKFTGDLHR